MGAPWTESDIPDQTGRVAVVTGASAGLGEVTARELARAGATVVMAVRNPAKAEPIQRSILADSPGAQVTIAALDVADLSSVRAGAAAIAADHPRIDLLINNAGVMYTPKAKTADGFELQIGTNHLGAFALTGLLLPNLTEVVGSRVVAVASLAHNIRAKVVPDDLNWEHRRYDRVAAYGQSKLANLMFTYALQRRLAEAGSPTMAVAAHPGVSTTELTRHLPGPLRLGFNAFAPLFTQPPDRGARPTLRAATDPEVVGGQYYGPDRFQEFKGDPVLVRSNGRSHDEDGQEALWSASERLTGVTFPV